MATKTRVVLTQKQQERYNRWWKAYPHKSDPEDAKRAFKQYDPDDAEVSRWIEAIGHEKRYRQWLRDTNQFCPPWKGPGRWIRAGSFDSELRAPHRIAERMQAPRDTAPQAVGDVLGAMITDDELMQGFAELKQRLRK